MQIRIPRKKIREKFLLIYELEGCQKAVNFLSKYYGIRKMRIELNGRKVGKGYEASYFAGRAYFSKRSLKKKLILHEFVHHIVSVRRLEIPERKEEKIANDYVRDFLSFPKKSYC